MDRSYPHRDEIAVRYKERGRLHTCSWAALREGAPTHGHTLGRAWVEGLRAETAHSSWSRNDVLWIEPALAERDARWIGAWRASGAVLAVDETREADDRRELAPTVVIASARYFERLKVETQARLERGALRSLARWAFAHPARALARAVILRPVADQLGLARVHRAITADAIDAETRAWFAALAIHVEPPERAPVALPARLIEVPA